MATINSSLSTVLSSKILFENLRIITISGLILGFYHSSAIVDSAKNISIYFCRDARNANKLTNLNWQLFEFICILFWCRRHTAILCVDNFKLSCHRIDPIKPSQIAMKIRIFVYRLRMFSHHVRTQLYDIISTILVFHVYSINCQTMLLKSAYWTIE